jgi:AraC-like DNA-binding protein
MSSPNSPLLIAMRSPARDLRLRHRLKRVLDYIGDNVAADLHLAQLAAVAGMSSHYFAELFRQSTGLAPHQYVLSHRIERAKQSECFSCLSIVITPRIRWFVSKPA